MSNHRRFGGPFFPIAGFDDLPSDVKCQASYFYIFIYVSVLLCLGYYNFKIYFKGAFLSRNPFQVNDGKMTLIHQSYFQR